MDLKEELKKMAMHLGADVFGVASADAIRGAPPGHRVKDVLPNTKSIIVLGMKMLDAQTDIIPTGRDHFGASSRQDMFRGHNTFISQELDRVGYAVARFLEKSGFRAYHQMASTGGTDQRYLMGLLSLKHIAVKAGLGVFGLNSLLITPQYGPRVRLTAIATDAEIEPDTPLNENFCKTCENPCLVMCPANALKKPTQSAPYEINKFACCQYQSTRLTCGICLRVCPVGNKRIR